MLVVAAILHERKRIPRWLASNENEHTDGLCALGLAVREQCGDIYAVSTPVPGTRYERVKGSLSQTLLECRELIDR